MLKPHTFTFFSHAAAREIEVADAATMRACIILGVASGDFIIFRAESGALCGISRNSRTMQIDTRELTDAEFDTILRQRTGRVEQQRADAKLEKPLARLLQHHVPN